MIRGVYITGDRSDRLYGVSVLTNDQPGHQPGHDAHLLRSVALVTFLLGERWLHMTLYARKDGRYRVPRSWGLSYEPGYGWTLDFGTDEEVLDRQIMNLLTGRPDPDEGA